MDDTSYELQQSPRLSAHLTLPPPTGADERVWLTQFLSWQIPLTLLVLVACAAVAVRIPSFPWIAATVLLATYSGVTIWAREQVRRGRLQRAGVTLSIGMLLFCPPVLVLLPEAWWVAASVTVASVTIALPYLSVGAARRLIAVAASTSLVVIGYAGAMGLVAASSEPEALFIAFGGVICAALTFGRLWHYHAHLTRLLAETSAGRDALSRANRELATRAAEMAAREERYRRISELTSDYVYSAGVTADGELMHEWMTDAFTRITGYTPVELGLHGLWEQLYHPDDLHIGHAHVASVTGGESTAFEFRIITKSGAVRWLREYCYPEWDDGEARVVRVVGAVQDITERKQAEEARLAIERKMLEAQKLESLGVLAGGIAHDFNNLLTVIQGNASLAQAEIAPETNARRQIELVDQAARRAADLTKQMLAYAGRGRFVIQRISLNALIDDMSTLLESSVSKSVRLTLLPGAGLPPIEGDITELRQVLLNLVINASDAIGAADGDVRVATGAHTVAPGDLDDARIGADLAPGEYVAIEVHDTGCGMDEATLGRIFEPFFTTKFAGRGLGLAAVLGIVRSHRGVLRVWSELGKGTTFRILLPPAPRAAAEHTALPERFEAPQESCGVREYAALHAEQPSGGPAKVVLVVDDEPGVRQVASQIVASIGARAIQAGDGREAVDLYRAYRTEISCVLMDLTMPRMGGDLALREILALNPSAQVVLMSGYSEEEATAHFAGAGLVRFMQKPFRVAEMRSVLRRALEVPG
jgi:PAS domain S-box-containing protein